MPRNLSDSWYTYATDNNQRNTCLLAGPYPSLNAAKDDLRRVQDKCYVIDGYSHWWKFISVLLKDTPDHRTVAFPLKAS